MMYFCETLTRVDVACKYFSSIGYSNYIGTDVLGKSGGTIFVWSVATQIQILDITPNWIHLEWKLESG